MPEIVYPWKRYWYPGGGQISLADDGFLVDPESETAKYYPSDVVPFSAIQDTRCLILLGEPGIGKSKALRAEFEYVRPILNSSGDKALWFDLRGFSSEDRLERKLFESDELRDWLGGQGTLHLFLDSLDEGLLRIDNISQVLLAGFQNLPPDRLRLRIASRPLDWQVTLENGLIDFLGQANVRAFQLAPLRKHDVTVAAKVFLPNPDSFLEQVIHRNVVPFAIKPVTLNLLIKIFDQGGALPESRAELYSKGCKRLCEEQNPWRNDSPTARANLTSSERMAIASRIAAVTQLSNRAAIWIGLDAELQPEDVAIESLVGGFEGSRQHEISVNLATIRETLDTGLFSSRGLSRQGWQHQTYSEYLAAFYLNAHEVPVDRLRVLFVHSDGSGKVIPQLRETAAWLSTMNHLAFELLAQTDPEILLRSDLGVASDSDRSSLARHLLESFASGHVPASAWWMRADFTCLNNPDLPGIVRPYLSDPALSWEARLTAIDIASSCRLTSLLRELVAIAVNPKEPMRLRSSSASAVADFGDQQARVDLRPLALGIAGEDPDDELKGHGLRATWPMHISAFELLGTLKPIKDPHRMGGAYYRFLSTDIAAQFSPADLVVAIEWARKYGKGSYRTDRLHILSSAILERAADYIYRPVVLELLATAFFERMVEYADNDRLTAKLRACGDATRRTVAHSMFPLAAANPHGAYFIMDACALGSPDIPWLLGELTTASDNKVREVITEIISRKLDPTDVDTYATVLAAATSDQILGTAIQPMVAPVELGSAQADRLKTEYNEFLSDQQPGITETSVPIGQRISEILSEVASDAFFKIYWLLFNDYRSSLHGDPLPGWSGLDDKTRILAAALDYLKSARPELSGDWWKEGVRTIGMLAGGCALRLLAIHSPALLEQLEDSDWVFWTKVALTDWSGESKESGHSIVLAKAYPRAKSTFLTTFSEIIDGENKRYQDVFILEHIAGLWNHDLAAILRSKITSPALKPKSFKKLLAMLLSKGDPTAKAVAQAAIAGVIPSDHDSRLCRIYASAELVSHNPREWDAIWPALQANEKFGIEALEVFASDYEYTNLATALTEMQIADICIWLSKVGRDSAEEDADQAGLVTPPIALANWWNTLVNILTNKGSPSACDALRRLIRELPQYEGLKYSLARAEELMRRATWIPMAPSEVIRLAAGTRLVISIHGIRTRGEWQKGSLNSDLQKNGFRHESLDFGFFRIIKLIWPSRRRRQVDWFRSEYERMVGEEKLTPSIVAHSFGSYIVAEAITRYPEIQFSRIILCGAIVRRDYDWDSVIRRGQVRAVLNEYSSKDWIVKLGEIFISDAGTAGALGFETSNPYVFQHNHPTFHHSDYFYRLNYRDNWIPFLNGLEPNFDSTGLPPKPNLKFRVLLFFLVVTMLVVVYLVFRNAH